MSKPIVYHAGCGGAVTATPTVNGVVGWLFCRKCLRSIVDALELTQRGTAYEKEPETSTELDRVAQ